jgi:hypothetical protein
MWTGTSLAVVHSTNALHKEALMEPRRDEKTPHRKIMEEIPQEPMAADPTEEDDAKDETEEDDSEDERIGRPVELEDDRR